MGLPLAQLRLTGHQDLFMLNQDDQPAMEPRDELEHTGLADLSAHML